MTLTGSIFTLRATTSQINKLMTLHLCQGSLERRERPALVRLRQRAAILAVKNRSSSERSEVGTVLARIRSGSIKNLGRIGPCLLGSQQIKTPPPVEGQ